jgi:hypothetical protein
MPKLKPRPGSLGLALTAYDIWRRLPKERRRQILEQVRKHGPGVARAARQAATDRLRKR